MDTKLIIQNAPGYLRVTCSGRYPSTNYREILGSILKEAVHSGNTRVLIDGRDLAAPPTELDRFDLGVAIAELFGSRIKIAILGLPAMINKFAENTAVNRGAQMLVVSEEEVALRWLVGKGN